jgi:2,4-dienoyl-CoA reductase-like NADH-dependent reductase (Old Yellow Enzyme family)
MSILFESTVINGIDIQNRLIRSATWEGMAAKNGTCTSQLTETMIILAKGGVGLIITGHTYVLAEGQAGPGQLGIHNDSVITGLEKMTNAVHKAGGKIILQLAHAGFYAATNLTGTTAWAPSTRPPHSQSVAKEMTINEIKTVIEAYGRAAARAKKAGFDGVQLHAAHGYLLSEFLSPAFNCRNDQYGGPLENRARIVLEVLAEIRDKVGSNYPVLAKLNCQDFLENGLSIGDSLQIGTWLGENGLDAIELSGGTSDSGNRMPVRPGKLSIDKEAYYRDAAKKFKDIIGIPLILVGGIRSFQVAENLVEEGIADYVSMSRPFIREPNLVNRWRAGDRNPSTCKSDNQCFGPAMSGEGIYCVTERREREKKVS